MFLAVEHLPLKVWVSRNVVGDNFLGTTIDNWRKVELLIFKMEFSHVSKPMSVRNNCVKIALD